MDNSMGFILGLVVGMSKDTTNIQPPPSSPDDIYFFWVVIITCIIMVAMAFYMVDKNN